MKPFFARLWWALFVAGFVFLLWQGRRPAQQPAVPKIGISAAGFPGKKPAQFIVTVFELDGKTVLQKFTNCSSVSNDGPFCTVIRYGSNEEFHAFAVPLKVEVNP